MSDLTAIDILVDPDPAAIERARNVNARLLQSVPSPPGWELDDSHMPHITHLQRYVRTAQLDHVNDTPHLTVGVATFDDLEIIEAEPPMGQAAR